MKKFFILIAATLTSLTILANGVEIDGIYYLLDEAELSATVTYMGEDYNTDNKYTGRIIIPETVTDEGGITYTVTKIGDRAFYKCNTVKYIKIPNTVTTLGGSSFCYCYALEQLIIPASVTGVYAYLFTGMSTTRDIVTCYALNPPYVQFSDLGSNQIIIHVPAESIKKYQTTYGWNKCDVKPILLSKEATTTSTATINWAPVENADKYEVSLEAYVNSVLAYTDTLYIEADSNNGGIMKEPAAMLANHRMPKDEIGTIIVITIDPASGTSAENPFALTISNTLSEEVDCRIKVKAYHEQEVLKEDQILITLDSVENSGNKEESLIYTTQKLPTTLYDLQGRGYPIDQYQTLPAGIYLVNHQKILIR